jgi:hypothetical protein
MYRGRPQYTIGRLGYRAWRRFPAPSLVVTRTLSEGLGQQTYIPSRFLQGILPEALLNEYQVWQNMDDSLTGYQLPSVRLHTKVRARAQNSSHSAIPLFQNLG